VTRARTGRGALLVALALLATACGVPRDDQPRALTGEDVPFTSMAPSAAPDADGDRRVELWFVRDGRVVPTSRRVDGPTDAPQLVELLFAGASQQERESGLLSVVPATLTVEDVEVRGGTAVLTLQGPDSEVRRLQPLAYAQIVATLTSGGVEGVRFRLDGRDLPVPRGDGSLSDGPVSRADYAELLAAPEAAAVAPSPPAAPPAGPPPEGASA